MSDTSKKIMNSVFNKLKKAFEKVAKPTQNEAQQQLVLQPIRNNNKRYF